MSNRVGMLGSLLMPSVLILTLPLVLSTARDMSLATTAIIYGCVASGLGLLYGRLGLLSMAHAGLWGVGAYAGFITVLRAGWSFWTAMAFSVLVTAAVGGIVSLPALRVKGHHFLIVTFVITEFLVVIGDNWTGLTRGREGILMPRPPDPLFGITFESLTQFYYLAAACLIALVLLHYALAHSRIGRMFEAIRENKVLAESLGINTMLYTAVGFALSGVFAGVGGVLFAYQLKHIEPQMFGLAAAVLLPLIVLIGGARYLWGPPLGAFIVVFLPEVLRLSPTATQAANGALLAVIIILMPAGAMGGLSWALRHLSRIAFAWRDGLSRARGAHSVTRATDPLGGDG